RYANACHLPERARSGGPLALLDVGTGLGWNLAAALAALDGTNARLVATSLERDPEVIRAALRLPCIASDPVARRWHAIVAEALEVALAIGAQESVPMGDRGEVRL